MPPYNANIPQPTDQLSVSQADILNNFMAIKTLIDVNHVDFSGGANQGKHFFIEFPIQSPVPTTAAGEVGLYSQTSTLTSQPELVFSKQSGTSVYEFTSSGQLANGGWVRSPSGILMLWGTGGPGAAGAYTVTYPVNASTPVFAFVYSSFVTPTSNIVVYVTSVTTTQINLNVSGAGSFNYLIIGI